MWSDLKPFDDSVCIPHSANKLYLGGAPGVMVIVVGNVHGYTSSNPGRD